MVKHGTKTERQKQILEAAVKCFGRSGYNSTTMDQIAEEAGLSKGSLYNYYKDKQTLFLSILQSYWDVYQPVFEELITKNDTSAADKLRALVAYMAEITEQAAFEEVSGLIIDFYSRMRFDDDVNAKLVEFLNVYIDMLTGVIRAGIASGEFRAVDQRAAAITIAGVMDGLGIYHLMGLNDFQMNRDAQAFMDIFLKGLENNNHS